MRLQTILMNHWQLHHSNGSNQKLITAITTSMPALALTAEWGWSDRETVSAVHRADGDAADEWPCHIY